LVDTPHPSLYAPHIDENKLILILYNNYLCQNADEHTIQLNATRLRDILGKIASRVLEI
jgi:hypothetical protein